MLDLSSNKKIIDAKYWFKPINQLYHPLQYFKLESQSVVYSYNNINKSNYYPILIKEWFEIVKKDGYLVIDYYPNKILNFQRIEENFWWLFKNRYEIIYHGPTDIDQTTYLTSKSLLEEVENKKNLYIKNGDSITITHSTNKNKAFRFICKKIISSKIPGDTINKWSFGIITNGKRPEWIARAIESIRNQKIPNYEIIICGNYKGRIDKDIIYIPFSQRDDLGWITKKKNLIARAAYFENLCIIHDRFILSSDWFNNIKKWGNCFDFLWLPASPPNTKISNEMVSYFILGQMAFAYVISNSTWSYNIFSGPIIVSKKSTYLNVMLNETSYWGCNNDSLPEDLLFTYESIRKGYIYRNPNVKFFDTLYERGSIFGSGFLKKLIYMLFSYVGAKLESNAGNFKRPLILANYYMLKKSPVSKVIR